MNADKRSKSYISKLELGLIVMAVLSVAIILIPSERLRTSFTLIPTDYPAALIDDAYSGGNSQVRWLDPDSQRWQCELGRASVTPYCSVQLDVTNAEDVGMDLSHYDKVTIWADYRGSASHVRIYLRNRHPNYYDPNNSITTKYNSIEVHVDELATGLELRMEDFTVASWWLIQREVPINFSQPEFNEVSLIEVQTGSSVRSGTHEIQLQKIVWSGPLIAQASLYQGVIMAWSIVIFGMLLHRLLHMRTDLNRERQYQHELLAINRSLNLESRHYEDLAKTDALTGLPNRVGIREVLHQGLKDWREESTPFAFIVIDLDNFKKINDTHGHDIGDKILTNAAHLMLSRVRRTDALARWGGEEFVLVCPNTTLDQALQVAENLRAELEHSLSYQGTVITASFGVAAMTEPNLDNLFKRADIALYKAKSLGRNCVYSDFNDEDEAA